MAMRFQAVVAAVVLGIVPTLFAQGARQVDDINATPLPPVGLTPEVAVVGEWVYYAGDRVAAAGVELYRSHMRGLEVPQQVGDLRAGLVGSQPFALTPVGSKLFFVANDGVHGNELWITDGTATGTSMVRDIQPGLGSSMWLAAGRREPLGRVGAQVFFAAADGASGVSLWCSDGTSGGTRLVRDLQPGRVRRPIGPFVEFQGRLFFAAVEGVTERLWTSDGTALGTRALLDLGPYTAGTVTTPARFSADSEALFCGARGALHRITIDERGRVQAASVSYGALDHLPLVRLPSSRPPFGPGVLFSHGASLLYSDGVKIVAMGLQYGLFSYDQEGAQLQPDAFFVGFDLRHGNELWRTDGTPGGTMRLRDLRPGPHDAFDPRGARPRLVRSGARFYFAADDGRVGVELWASDGSSGGTRLVADVNPGPASSHPRRLTPLPGGGLLFVADHVDHGTSLWAAHLSPPAVMLLDADFVGRIRPTATDHIRGLQAHATAVFFAADDGRSGSELWRSDGGADGTSLVRDIDPDGSALREHDLKRGAPAGALVATRRGNDLFFTAYDRGPRPGPGLGLWRSGGTAATTSKVIDLEPLSASLGYPLAAVTIDDRLFFGAMDARSGPALWSTRGSRASTRKIAAGWPGPMVRLGKQVVFADGTPNHVDRVVVSDGTVAGTRQLRALSTAVPRARFQMLRVGRGVLFSADGALWVTDGTPAGTRQLGLIPVTAMAQLAGRLFLLAAMSGGTTVLVGDATTVPVQIAQLPGRPVALAGSAASSRPASSSRISAWFAIRRSGGSELWRSDGTPGGTKWVQRFPDGPKPAEQAHVDELVAVGDRRVFFSVSYDYHFGTELWASDGTTAGTKVVADIHAGPGDSDPRELTLAGGRLFFTAAPRGGKDRRLHVVHPGASSAWFGPGIAASGFVPRLRATDPVIGGKMSLVLTDAVPNAAGVFAFGRPARPAIDFGGGTHLYVDPRGVVLLPIYTDAFGSARILDTRVPSRLGLRGIGHVAQFLVGPTGQLPLRLDFSDALYLMPY